MLRSLIQKFNRNVGQGGEAIRERDDIIVITDAGAPNAVTARWRSTCANALPNASYIGFTGTPLFKDDRGSPGGCLATYVSTYDFQRAVEDQATVPLYYDSSWATRWAWPAAI